MPGHCTICYTVFMKNSIAFNLVGTNITHSSMGGQNKLKTS